MFQALDAQQESDLMRRTKPLTTHSGHRYGLRKRFRGSIAVILLPAICRHLDQVQMRFRGNRSRLPLSAHFRRSGLAPVSLIRSS